MDLTNSFEQMKELHKLQQIKNTLVKKQRLSKLTEQLNSVSKLKQSFEVNLKEIEACTLNINKNFDQVEEILTGRTERKYIPMPKETAQNLKEIKHNIVEIFNNTQLINTQANLEELPYNENVDILAQQISVSQNEQRNACKYGSKLINNIKLMKCKLTTTIINEDDSNKISSEIQCRSRLSDSTFISTFDANNVSASSPIGEFGKGLENKLETIHKILF